jgi:hypothetical protein
MNTAFRILALAAVSWPLAAHAQLQIQPVGTLDFGAFVVVGSGTVRIDAAGMRTASGGVILIPSHAGTPARFVVSNGFKQDSLCGAISLLHEGTLLTNKDIVSLDSRSVGLVPAGQSLTVAVGATLQVAAPQAPGSYSNDNAYHVKIDCDKQK